jgi:acetyl esterase/lipase
VFVLAYRLPGEGWAAPADTPLQDAQRAMRLVRARAAAFGVDAARIGVLGFSAGGHLASTLATRHGEAVYRPQDAADGLSARPDFAGLIYPVITMGGDKAEKGSRRNLLGRAPSETAIAARSSERQVDRDTAPCFLVHGMDDKVVPVENSLMMLEALRRNSVRCEAHLFQEGAHGFGVGLPGQGHAEWPRLFLAWLRRLSAHA